MTRDEIESHLNAGRSRSVRVDISPLPEFPGYVRTVTIRAGGRVTVEFNIHGHDEGGPIFEHTFATIEEAIAALERYFGKPLAQWVNFSRTGEYPEPLPSQDIDEGHKQMAAAISANRVPLPTGNFRLKPDGYWAK